MKKHLYIDGICKYCDCKKFPDYYISNGFKYSREPSCKQISKMTYKLKTVDLTNEGQKKFTTYFFKKGNEIVYKVFCDGTRCSKVTADKIGISGLRSSYNLPKYITRNLGVYFSESQK